MCDFLVINQLWRFPGLTDQSNKIKTIDNKLEEVKHDFLRLLEEIPDIDWDRKLSGEGWTAKQEMVHIVQVLQVLPAGIKRARAGGKRSLLGFVPAAIRSWINGRILIPLKARKETRESIARTYKEAHKEFVRILGELTETDLRKGMPYPRKYRTVAQMAYRPVEHFKEHEAHLRQFQGNRRFEKNSHLSG